MTHILEYSVLGRRVRELATIPLQVGSRQKQMLFSAHLFLPGPRLMEMVAQ